MRPADNPPRWFDHQVSSALIVGTVAGGYFQDGVRQVAGKWLAAPPAYDGPTGYILAWLAAFLFIGGWWARPIARFLEDRDPALRGSVRAERCEDVRLKGKQRALVLYKLA